MISLYSDVLQALTVALPLFLIGVLSPGPATLAIMMFSVKLGRRNGFAFALGVSAGSFFWGTAAALGLGSFLIINPEITIFLRIAGGIYLLWMAFVSLRSSFRGHTRLATESPRAMSISGMVFSGLMLHLLNPKAIFVWLAVVSVGLGNVVEPNALVAQSMVLVCWFFSLVVFTGYSVLFSSKSLVATYQRYTRIIDAICGLLFVAAGLTVISGAARDLSA